MTPSQVELVKDGFQIIYQEKQEFARSFFTFLFQVIPGIRTSYPEDMTEQHRKLAETMTYVIYHLHDPAALQKSAELVASRHIGTEARRPHFVAAAVALEQSLQKHLSPTLPAEELDAWQQAFFLVTDIMSETNGINAA